MSFVAGVFRVNANSSSSTGRAAWRAISSRILVAAVGGYALCWSLFLALCAWLPYQKVTLWYLTGQLAPLPFLFALLAAFAARSAGRMAAWIFGLAGFFYLLGRLA